MTGKLIRLFLADGKPDGLRTVEISNLTLYGTIFPRTQLAQFAGRPEAQKPAIYLLLGADEQEPDQTVLYIGEGDPVMPRLKDHVKNKDFWTEAMVFSSKDGYLTKTQIQYLEAELYALAKDAFRVKLDNCQIPTKPNISEVEESEVVHFLEHLKLLLVALGRDFLEPRVLSATQQIAGEQVFELKIKNLVAEMVVVDNKYVVRKGSQAVLENLASIPGALAKVRKELITAGIMVDQGDGAYTLHQDAVFNSPSYAAALIVGGAANGRKAWKCQGRMLKEWEETAQ